MKKQLLALIFLGFLVLPTVVLAIANLPTLGQKIQDAFVIVASFIVVIGWIITGVLFLTSAGAPEKLSLAKKSLIACVIGTAVVVVALGMEAFIKTLLGV